MSGPPRYSTSATTWPICPGAGQPPVKVTIPMRPAQGSRPKREARGVCSICKKVMAVRAGLVVDHAPYRTDTATP